MAKEIIRPCRYCKKPFQPPRGNPKKGYGFYCSRPCFWAHYHSQWQTRFWSNVKKTEHGCWVWAAGRRDGRYGEFCNRRRNQAAHRVSYEIANGPIPKGKWVLHRCDNPPCVRPDHLFLGTHRDNMKDRHDKGRYPVGEAHAQAVLTEDVVRQIRHEYKTLTTTYVALAGKCGTTKQAVGFIVRRDTWKHVD